MAESAPTSHAACARSQVILPNAVRDDNEAFRDRLRADAHLQAALRTAEPRLRAWFNVHTQSMWLREQRRGLQFQQWQDLLKKGWGTCAPGTAGAQVGYSPGYNVGTWEIYQDSEITGDERCRAVHYCALSFPTVKLAFINSQVALLPRARIVPPSPAPIGSGAHLPATSPLPPPSLISPIVHLSQGLDQMTVGQAKTTDAMLTLEYSEFEECMVRCALEKYKTIVNHEGVPMTEAAMVPHAR